MDSENFDSFAYVYVCGYTSFKLGADLKCRDCNTVVVRSQNGSKDVSQL